LIGHVVALEYSARAVAGLHRRGHISDEVLHRLERELNLQ
jgi:hypothetical protein